MFAWSYSAFAQYDSLTADPFVLTSDFWVFFGTTRVGMQATPLSLNFNCTCWQNRKARIYLSGPDFESAADQTFRKNLEHGNTRIVLSRSNASAEMPLIILPDGSQVHMLADRTYTP